jgi:hypothetical protein
VILVPHLDDSPYLPDVGELYWVDTTILDAYDKKPRRPALVLVVPAELTGRITLATRTSDTARSGVRHDPDPALGLRLEGVFHYLRTAEAQLWTPGHVTYMDRVDPQLLADVLQDFGL